VAALATDSAGWRDAQEPAIGGQRAIQEILGGSAVPASVQSAHPAATRAGLALALFGSPIFIAGYRLLSGENHSDWQMVGRELAVLLMAGLLLWIVRNKETLPFSSIGWRGDALGRSIARGLGLTVIVLAATIALYVLLQQAGIRLGAEHGNGFHPSLVVTTLVMLRAGIVEELCYRGYAIERLWSLTGSKWLAWLPPLAIFAAAHYRQGLGGILAALVLGGIFTASYWKFRDLLANITAHFLGDFVLNVLLPLISGA